MASESNVVSYTSFIMVDQARRDAIQHHGALKPGPGRWSRLLAEEWQEVEDELHTLYALVHSDAANPGTRVEAINGTRQRLVAELAQLAQLCMGAIDLVLAGKLEEEK